MMKTNRIIAMALAALLSVSAFTACGSKKEETKDETKKPLTAEEQLVVDQENASKSEDTVDPATKDEAKKLADEITKRARDGEDFYSLVEEYGEDPGMYNNPEGYLFTYGTMVPEFEEASFALEVGEISDPVETTYGYHIIKKLPLDLDPASKEYLDIAYIIDGEELNTELMEFMEGLEIVYTDAFNETGIFDMGTLKEQADNAEGTNAQALPMLSNYDWKYSDDEVMFTVGGAPITFGEFRHYVMGNKAYMDGGDDSYWTEETTAEYKDTIINEFKLAASVKLLATSEKYGITLEDADFKRMDETITNYKVQFGEEGFNSLLEEIFVTEDIFKHMLEYQIYQEKLILAHCSDEEIMNYANENYVRVQHVLVSFTQEEATEADLPTTEEAPVEEVTEEAPAEGVTEAVPSEDAAEETVVEAAE